MRSASRSRAQAFRGNLHSLPGAAGRDFRGVQDEHGRRAMWRALSACVISGKIQDIADRLHTLHGYTSYDQAQQAGLTQLDFDQFITHQDIDKKLLRRT